MTGQALAGCKVEHFFCSDTGRAVATAEVIRRKAPALPLFVLDPRLRELSYGRWEGMLHEEIKAQFPELYTIYRARPEKFCAPDGESFVDLRSRVASFLAGFEPLKTETCLIVTHSGVVRAALGLLQKIPVEKFWETPSVPEGGICLIAYRDGSWQLIEEPNDRHLGE